MDDRSEHDAPARQAAQLSGPERREVFGVGAHQHMPMAALLDVVRESPVRGEQILQAAQLGREGRAFPGMDLEVGLEREAVGRGGREIGTRQQMNLDPLGGQRVGLEAGVIGQTSQGRRRVVEKRPRGHKRKRWRMAQAAANSLLRAG
ncbi:MAG: hypothetical protein WDO13_19345 [Verrucomicrobiota bacterium]